jgi:hypothetical protein
MPGREWGGFEHNLQSLRVVDQLEERYPAYDGLNLSFETREGILKHCSPVNARKIEAVDPGGVAHRFLDHSQPSLEAQLCNLADEIAYLLNMAHAIDHMFLLIFATAVGTPSRPTSASARWEDLMPYGVGAFVMFGLGSLPAGRLGDLWGRRPMMLVFFFGMGRRPAAGRGHAERLAAGGALTLLGAFARSTTRWASRCWCRARRPGATIGINGLAGNLGIAVARWPPASWCSGGLARGLRGAGAAVHRLGCCLRGWCRPKPSRPAKRKAARPRVTLAPASWRGCWR